MRAIDKLIQNAGVGEGTAWDYLNNQGETILNTNVTITEVVQDVSLEIGATSPALSIEITQTPQPSTVEGVEQVPDSIEVDITTAPVAYDINIGYEIVPEFVPSISTDADNRARYGSDNGVFVPQYEAPMDPVAYYILAKS